MEYLAKCGLNGIWRIYLYIVKSSKTKNKIKWKQQEN